MKTLACKFSSRRSGHAFSLLELLIVMAIIVVMYALYLGASSQDEQKRQMKTCQKNLQNIYVALKTYGMDFGGSFPTVPEATTSESPLSYLVPQYTTGTEYFICPASKDKKLRSAQPLANARISYAYYMGCRAADGASQPLMSDEQVDSKAKKTGQLVFSADGRKPGNNHNKFGGVLLFCDGSLRMSGTNAEVDLPLGQDIVLLNPKP